MQTVNCSLNILKVSSNLFGASDVADLHLLRAIENTVDGLQDIERLFEEYLNLCHDVIKVLANCKEHIELTDESLIGLEEAGQKLCSVIDDLRTRRQSAINDPKLNDDHQNDVVLSYDRVIQAGADLHNASVQLRWAVMEHNTDLDSDSENAPIFKNSDDLIAHLRG